MKQPTKTVWIVEDRRDAVIIHISSTRQKAIKFLKQCRKYWYSHNIYIKDPSIPIALSREKVDCPALSFDIKLEIKDLTEWENE